MNCSVEAARKHAQRGNFDPTDLLSVLEFVKHRLDRAPIVESDVVNEDDQDVRGALGRTKRLYGRELDVGILCVVQDIAGVVAIGRVA